MLKRLRAKWYYHKAKRRMKNRNVKRAKYLYWYFIIGGVFMFLYGIASIIFSFLPGYFTFAPLAIPVAYMVALFFKKNWKLIWIYLKDIDQGKLLLRLNEYTHYETEHKIKLIKWVYLNRKTIRNERRLELINIKGSGEEIRSEHELKYKTVFCPQQLMDGVNKAILVDTLIYAHENISVLDDNLREIMELTDENMQKFDLRAEIARCRTEERESKVDKYKKIGMEKSKAKKK